MPTFCGSCPACRLRTTAPSTACRFGPRCTRPDCKFAHASPAGTRHKAGPVPAACRYGIQCRSGACKFAHPSKSLVCNSHGGAAKGCNAVLTSPICPSALVRALEAMEEELARRVMPGERSVMLRQVSKTMRTAMERVRPPAMIKVRRGQRTKSVEQGILDMTTWCRITAIDLSSAEVEAEGAGMLAAVLGQCPSLAHLDL